MKKLMIFILISLSSNIFSVEEDSNTDQDTIESSIFYLQSKMAMPMLLSKFESYVNPIKSANDIFEFYKFFDQDKNKELSSMRLNGKLFNIIISDIYLKIIHDKFEELKAKAIVDYKDKSKEDLNKKLQDILNLEMSLKEKELRECCKLILAGADVNLESKFGKTTVLMIAVDKGCTELVKLLLDKNANTEIKNMYGWITLIIAVKKGYVEMVKLLLDKNANIDIQDMAGCTALMNAVNNGNIEMVNLLLDKNANINIQNTLGCTALMLAVNKGYNEIIKLLLDKNVKINIQNNKGQTALMLAENKGYNGIADLLRNKSS